jgi:hypothetical protein
MTSYSHPMHNLEVSMAGAKTVDGLHNSWSGCIVVSAAQRRQVGRLLQHHAAPQGCRLRL